MSTAREATAVLYALVSLRTGSVRVLEAGSSTPLAAALEHAPALFGTGKGVDWPGLFARLSSTVDGQGFRELVLISAGHVYVIERLTHQPDQALVAVTPAGGGLGLVLAGVHEQLARLDVG